MKNLHGIGIPYSIFFEDLFSKTYDSTKLEEDQQRLEEFYKDNGYFEAHATGAKVTVVDTGGGKWRLPLILSNNPGKGANIHISIEEGRLYHLNNINFVGVKLFRTPETLMRPVFQMSSGDVFSTAKLRKGFEELRKLYGNFGYIDFVAEPNIEPVPNTDKVDLTLNFDEGKQFFVRRIDFSGNTTTRDKIIRRELLVDEGDIYNTKLWEVSLLRLNQLGYFEVLKAEDAVDIKRDTKTDTVDITLKVKERGKNSIQLNGGVSGIAGSFIGFSYATNNLLGLGETLSLNSQLGTRQDNVTLGFTEPYFLDRPIQVGATVFYTRFDYNQAREASILAGQNLTAALQPAGRAEPVELRYQFARLHGIHEQASAPQFCPRWHQLWLLHSERHDADRRGHGVLHLHRLPAHQRAESSERHQAVEHYSELHLQLGEPPHHADGRKESFRVDSILGQRAGRQREPDPADGGREVLPPVAAEP